MCELQQPPHPPPGSRKGGKTIRELQAVFEKECCVPWTFAGGKYVYSARVDSVTPLVRQDTMPPVPDHSYYPRLSLFTVHRPGLALKDKDPGCSSSEFKNCFSYFTLSLSQMPEFHWLLKWSPTKFGVQSKPLLNLRKHLEAGVWVHNPNTSTTTDQAPLERILRKAGSLKPEKIIDPKLNWIKILARQFMVLFWKSEMGHPVNSKYIRHKPVE